MRTYAIVFNLRGIKAKEKTISLVRRFSARHSLLDFAACFRICNEQLRRGIVSLIWVLLGFVCAFCLAVQRLLPQLRWRRGFARKDLPVPKQLFSIWGEVRVPFFVQSTRNEGKIQKLSPW